MLTNLTILRILLPRHHPSVHDETGMRLGVWFGRSHGDNFPTSAWDCKTNLCIGSQCYQAPFLSSPTFPPPSHSLKMMTCIQQQPQKSDEDIIFIKLLNIIRIRNIAGIDFSLLIFHDYVNGDRIVLHQSPG